jgi:uroporphyrinogen decarboxylase
MTRRLSHKERFLRAINHEESDKIPTYGFKTDIGFDEKYMKERMGIDVIPRKNKIKFGQDQTVLVALGVDATTDPRLENTFDTNEFKFETIWRSDGSFILESGLIFKRASDGRLFYVEGAWTSLEVRNEQFPPRIPPPQRLFDRFEKFYNQKVIQEDKIYVFPIINGLHEGNWLNLGYVPFARELRKPTGLLKQTIDELHNVNIEICKRLLDIDSEMVIAFTDDIAQKGRLMISPDQFRKLYLPRYKSLFKMIHKRGGRIMIHTDGKIDELIPCYIEMGLDLLQCLEPAAGVDIIALNENYGEKIAWNGNIDVSVLLWQGTPEDVRRQCEKLINAVAPSNNLVFGPCTDIMAYHPIENIETLYDTARAYNIQKKTFDY